MNSQVNSDLDKYLLKISKIFDERCFKRFKSLKTRKET